MDTTVNLEIRFFAHFREAVGSRTIDYQATDNATIGEVLRELTDGKPDLDVFDESGSLRPHVNVLRNGRNVTYEKGLDTPLEDGDEVGVFPPVEGG